MQANKSDKAEELVVALGVLGHAQELGADDAVLSVLTVRVLEAQRDFRSTLLPGQ